MIKMLSASTREVEDAQIATQEILQQLDIENNLLQNSLGILTCHSDFLDYPALKAICQALPFDVVGCTTMACGNGKDCDVCILTLSVITADDVSFTINLSQSLAQPAPQETLDAYAQKVAQAKADARFILTFLPMMENQSGEELLSRVMAVSGDIPLFGTMAHGSEGSLSGAAVIYNGEYYTDCAALALFSGNINPQFFFASIPEEKTQKQKAIITSSDGSLLKTVNDMPMIQYLQSLGLAQGDGMEGMQAIPIVVNFGDGTPPVARAMYGITPEGHVVCGASVPVNSTLAIGSIDAEDVLDSAQSIAKQLMFSTQRNGALFFPCLSRNLALGLDTLAEMETLAQNLGGLPFHIAYSGGECCPAPNESGVLHNHFHNFSLICCAF